jgi:hypothetical protein
MDTVRRLALAIESLQAQIVAHEILLKELYAVTPAAVARLHPIDIKERFFLSMYSDLQIDMVDKIVAGFRAK